MKECTSKFETLNVGHRNLDNVVVIAEKRRIIKLFTLWKNTLSKVLYEHKHTQNKGYANITRKNMQITSNIKELQQKIMEDETKKQMKEYKVNSQNYFTQS